MAADEQTHLDPGALPPDVILDAPPDGSTAPRERGPAASDDEGWVTITQTSTGQVRATSVDASQAAIGQLTAREVRADRAALGFVRARRVGVSQGAVGALAAEHVETRDGFALLLLARRVSGNVTVLLDWRGVAAFATVVMVLRRLLRGRG